MKLHQRARNLTLWFAGMLLLTSGTPAMATASADDTKKEESKGLPLKSDRKIEFTTSEGTWTSLDVSPDGKTIIFDMVGNLYTIPIEGGEAKRITNEGMSFNQMPRFSPDGTHIAFLSDRDGCKNVWIAKLDGSDAKKLTSETHEGFTGFASPSWTPDSQYVLASYSSSAGQNIWMYHIKGGSGIQVTKSAGRGVGSYLGAVASPDGKSLYFAKGSQASWQIERRDLATGAEEPITHDSGSAFRPAVSPDGSLIVYATHHDGQTGLRVLELNTGNERWLKYPVQRDETHSFARSDLYPGFVFTPDGKDIVVTYGGKIHRVNVATGDEKLIPYTAHVTIDLGPSLNDQIRVEDGPTVRARLIQAPQQSPDGRQLAFSALGHMYLMDIPGGTPKRIGDGKRGKFQPAWSPDGQWIAYVTWTTEEGGHIWKMRADGSSAQKLTTVSAYYSSPAWTPDGSKIVALEDTADSFREDPTGEVLADGKLYQLVWVSADGGDYHVIAASHAFTWPHFSVEKDRVYVHAPRGNELVSMRLDGSDRRSEFKIGANNYGIQDMMLSPDGKFLAAAFNRNVYVLSVTRVGGEAPTLQLKEGASSVPVKKISDYGADYFAWADGGKTLTWAVGSSFFRQSMASVSFEPEKKKEGQSTEWNAIPDKKHGYEEITVNVEEPRKKPSGTVVLRGANVITMKGDEVVQDADVVVTDNRIAAVGKRGSVKVPAGAKVMDVHGNTIMPGMIDTHDHWMWRIGRNLLETQNWDYIAHIAYGVTTGRDPQTESHDAFPYEDLVDAGIMIGPRAPSTGAGIVDADFPSYEETYNVVKKYAEYYRTHTIKSYMIGNRKQRQWVVEACKRLHIMPTTEGGSDTMMDLTHAVDGFSGNEHALPIVPLYEDAVELMAKSGIAYTPTFVVNYGGPEAQDYFIEHSDLHSDPKVQRFFPDFFIDHKTAQREWHRMDQYHFQLVAASAAKILREGGIVCTGGHGEFPGFATHWEAWALQSGSTAMEALRAATLNGAKAIGYEQDLGSIEAGKLADLVVLTKDPLQDIHNTMAIRYVMKNGELFEGDTVNEIWPEQKQLPPLWFQKDNPR